MRKAVVGSSIFVTISCWLRLVPCKKSDHIYWVYASMLLNGAGAPALMFISPVLSNVWFPLSPTSHSNKYCYCHWLYRIWPRFCDRSDDSSKEYSFNRTSA
eukprot:UN17521